MKKPKYFILKRTAIDGKMWFCVCYLDSYGNIRTVTKHRLKKEAESYKKNFELNY